MNLKKKKLLEESFERIINVGFCIKPYEDLSDIIASDPVVFGTTKDERIFSIEEVDTLFKSQFEQMGSMDPKLERKRIATRISADGNNAFIVEEITLSISSPEAVNTIFMRASCVMENIDNRWKLTHWHTSAPIDTENDHWHMEEWKREKEKLQKLVDQQTTDLQVKNRELEIEAALERVRAQTMAMHSSEDVGKCVVKMFSELTALGVDEGTRFGIGILNHDNENNQLWTARKDGEEVNMHIGNLDMASHPLLKSARKAWVEQVPFHQYILEGENLLDYYRMLNTAPDYKIQIPIEKLPKREVQHCFIFEQGFFYAFSAREFQPELIDIIQRFSSQFAQTYRRYLDLVMAEAQAREAQIEVAVERVRAQSMAMHHTDDLHKVTEELLHQLNKLSIDGLSGTTIYLVDTDDIVEAWDLSSPGNIGTPGSYTITYDAKKYPILGGWVSEWRTSDQNYFALEFPREAILKAVEEWKEVYPEIAVISKNAVDSGKLTHQWSPAGRLSKGILAVDLTKPPTEDTKYIVTKMAGAFNLAYQRFEDLQKAEGQAREAEIELALERVRARTMAMQKSDELIETSELMFEQIKNLGIELWSCGFSLWYDDDSYFMGYNPGPDGKMGETLKIPLTEDIFFTTIREAKRRGDDFLVFESEGESLEQTYRYMDKLPVVGENMRGIVEAGYPLPTYQVTHCGFFSEGHLMFITQEPNPEAVDIFKRFTKVFDQTYTRFLDLQKAEKQAKEGQIQLALERVRARTMAMQHSDELTEASEVLDKQVRALGIETWGCAFHIYADDQEGDYEWFSSREGSLPFYKTPREKFFLSFYEKGQAGETFHVEEFLGDDCKKHYDYLMTLPVIGDALEEIVKSGSSLPDSQYDHVAFFKHGYVLFITYEPVPEAHEVFKRFAKVFEQTYTRFLDLQKAEAQAREAQIEAALERIRSRSMAMQKSEELSEVVRMMYYEVGKLELSNWGCALMIFDNKNENIQLWFSENINNQHARPYGFDNLDHQLVRKWWEFWKNEDEFMSIHLKDEENDEWTNYMFENTGMQDLPNEVKKAIRSENEVYFVYAKMKQGLVSFINLEPFNEEIFPVLKRIARTFEQAYTRFLDVLKAEEQAREAQINLAVERVRARALAMFKSEEILEVVIKLKEEIMGLHIPGVAAAAILLKENNGMFRSWDLTSLELNGESMHTPLDVSFDMEKTHPDFYLRKTWKKGTKYTVVVQDTNSLQITCDWLRKHNKTKEAEEAEQFIKSSGLQIGYHPTVPLNNGRMILDLLDPPEDEIEFILTKMGGAFDLAYTRFLDLQKAEEQAREAQIEAALERVRSRSLAMHHSSELSAVVDTLLQEFTQLEFTLTFCIINLIDGDDLSNTVWAANPETGKDAESYYMKFEDYDFHRAMWKAWKAQDKRFVYTLEGEEKKIYDEYLYSETEFRRFPKHVQEANKALDRYVAGFTFFKYSGLQTVSVNEITEAELEILERFGKVFEQAYTRFLDLQKAEAQAREAQIEAALERVRSRTMGMQESEELADVAFVLFEQLRALGGNLWGTGFGLCEKDSDQDSFWFANENGVFPPVSIPNTTDPAHKQMFKGWKADKDFLAIEASGKELKNHYDYMMSLQEVRPFFQKILNEGLSFPEWQQWNAAYFRHGYLLIITLEPYPDPDVLVRFTKVFEQTYTRFLDLKKAEAQAREAQIEAALERVRSRSMAMHKTEELADAIGLLQRELAQLEFALDNCIFWIIEKESNEATMWLAPINNTNLPEPYHVPFTNLPYFNEVFQAWELRNSKWTYVLEGEDKKRVDEYLFNQTGFRNFTADIKKIFLQVKKTYVSISFYNYGGLHVSTEVPISESQREILSRFSKVFDQTYTRFLDLQKAEEQAREAKIEAALERVRARSMGMQKSEELIKVVRQIGQELKEMDIDVHNSQIWSDFSTDPSDGLNLWVDVPGQSYLEKFHIPFVDQPITLNFFDALKGLDYFSDKYSKEVKDQYFKVLFKESDFKRIPKERKDFIINAPGWVRFTVILKESCLHFGRFNLDDFTDEEKDIFKRIGKVFGQAYTRFLDLQKAEGQAREALIGNALEKVRSRSLAMQSPDELVEVAQLLREEMGALGVEELETSSIYIHDELSGKTQCWFTIKDSHDPGKAVADQMIIDLKDTWVGRQMDEFYRSNQDKTSILMKGDHRIEWIRYCEEKSDLFGNSEFYGETIPERTYHLYKFSNGFLGAASPGDISDESWDLMKRATGVFSFAYTRFRDLQKAEESARIARQQASLDRVRADISSMRSADDLDRVTPLIWNELTTLGIPFIRCGVFIVQEEEKQLEVYLSKPDGTSLAVMHLPFDSSDLVGKTVAYWKKDSVYTQHWTREEFLDWGRSMMVQNQISNMKTYQGADEAPESLNLHFIPFNQGMLYVGSTEPLEEEEIGLAESLAKAFSVAYARYEDFVKLEKAKTSIEDALSELKATQSQLVQQEKLASLGQLTAGIAHEIKNPLNFVNNFSEISREMILEVREEIETVKSYRDRPLPEDSLDEISAILDDIESNLEKIHHHGTRANGIVTSMLQHSRGGSGKMEPTDLNAIIKEYVNLSFHGMRAGKNPINVDIDFQLENEVGTVKVVPEDFSRVMVNLCNNAFDAMRIKTLSSSPSPSGGETQKGRVEGHYKPLLTIRTKSDKNKVLIEVEDNGSGIPDKIKDKILQPFFTTKKGTEGTGLGLSISHGIVKARGGEIEINSLPGEGSTFTIQLPK